MAHLWVQAMASRGRAFQNGPAKSGAPRGRIEGEDGFSKDRG